MEHTAFWDKLSILRSNDSLVLFHSHPLVSPLRELILTVKWKTIKGKVSKRFEYWETQNWAKIKMWDYLEPQQLAQYLGWSQRSIKVRVGAKLTVVSFIDDILLCTRPFFQAVDPCYLIKPSQQSFLHRQCCSHFTISKWNSEATQ